MNITKIVYPSYHLYRHLHKYSNGNSTFPIGVLCLWDYPNVADEFMIGLFIHFLLIIWNSDLLH